MVARKNPVCKDCGEDIHGIYANRGKTFVGDNFVRWDVEGHKCPTTVDPKKVITKEPLMIQENKSKPENKGIYQRLNMKEPIEARLFYKEWMGSDFEDYEKFLESQLTKEKIQNEVGENLINRFCELHFDGENYILDKSTLKALEEYQKLTK